MVRLSEKAGHIGRQRRQHLQALARPLRRADEFAIVAKAFEVQRSQSFDQPANRRGALHPRR